MEPGDDTTFLMAGDLNQAVRAQSRRGDVPWKRIHGAKLDFSGRVRYIEKNYRNSKEIGEYIHEMLKLMNNRLSMLGLINSMEYDYNSFTIGNNPTVALKIKAGLNRQNIKKELCDSVKEIVRLYKVSYSDIAILFPVRKKAYLRYYFLYWLEEAFREADIPYSMIINDDNSYIRTKYSNANGVIVSTIESSLGLDFKAVILAGLFPYNYVFPEENSSKEIRTWSSIKGMTEKEQNLVQSQIRSIYTACSRARDILYVLSDLKSGSPMDEIVRVKRPSGSSSVDNRQATNRIEEKKVVQPKIVTHTSPKHQIEAKQVADHMKIEAIILETNKDVTILIDLAKYPTQKCIVGKKVGDTFKFRGKPSTYKIVSIMNN